MIFLIILPHQEGRKVSVPSEPFYVHMCVHTYRQSPSQILENIMKQILGVADLLPANKDVIHCKSDARDTVVMWPNSRAAYKFELSRCLSHDPLPWFIHTDFMESRKQCWHKALTTRLQRKLPFSAVMTIFTVKHSASFLHDAEVWLKDNNKKET